MFNEGNRNMDDVSHRIQIRMNKTGIFLIVSIFLTIHIFKKDYNFVSFFSFFFFYFILNYIIRFIFLYV